MLSATNVGLAPHAGKAAITPTLVVTHREEKIKVKSFVSPRLANRCCREEGGSLRSAGRGFYRMHSV